MSVQAQLTKGFTVKATGDYRPILADKRVIGEIQLRRDGSISLRLKDAPAKHAPVAVRRAFETLPKNAKWACLMKQVTEANVREARLALELAAAGQKPAAPAAPKKRAAAKTA
jgi:hypothetical protein